MPKGFWLKLFPWKKSTLQDTLCRVYRDRRPKGGSRAMLFDGDPSRGVVSKVSIVTDAVKDRGISLRTKISLKAMTRAGLNTLSCFTKLSKRITAKSKGAKYKLNTTSTLACSNSSSLSRSDDLERSLEGTKSRARVTSSVPLRPQITKWARSFNSPDIAIASFLSPECSLCPRRNNRIPLVSFSAHFSPPDPGISVSRTHRAILSMASQPDAFRRRLQSLLDSPTIEESRPLRHTRRPLS